MASVERLMGVGVPDEVAKRTGFFVKTFTSSDNTAVGPGNLLARVSTSTLVLSNNYDIGDMLTIMFVTNGTCNPPSTDQFNLKTTAEGMVMTAGVSKDYMKISSTQWLVSGSTA